MTEAHFTVGPAHVVTDSRNLPAVSADEELQYVSGANQGSEHPDNEQTDDLRDTTHDALEDEHALTEEELEHLIENLDLNAPDLHEPYGPEDDF
jgi:hypothetical protein